MIAERIAAMIVAALAVYVALGVAFACAFVARGVERVDPTARGSGWAFRVMIFPGSVALWPLLGARWLLGRETPLERNAHRRRARDLR